MKTDQFAQPTPVFPQMVSVALGRLKQQLQHEYQQAYPALGEIIHLVLDEEEARARELSSFPHLFLPDLVEAHVEKLGLHRAEIRPDDVVLSHDFATEEMPQPAFALCG